MTLTRRAQRLFEELPGEMQQVFIAGSRREQQDIILSKIFEGTMGLEVNLSQELENLDVTGPVLSYLDEKGIAGRPSTLIGAIEAVVPYSVAKELSDMGYTVGIPAPKTTKATGKAIH